MRLTSAGQLGVPFSGDGPGPTPPPSQPSISTTDLLVWWDPGNPSGYVTGSPNKLINLAPTGATYDASQTTYVSGAGAGAALDAAGRYISFGKGSTGGAFIFKTPSITTGFIPANQAFTWISWYYGVAPLYTTSHVSLALMNFNAPPFYVRFNIGSTSRTYTSNSTGASTFTGTPAADTWYMLAMTVGNAGGSGSTTVTRNAYINGVLNATSTGTVTNATVSRTIAVGMLSGANNSSFRQGMCAVYTAALTVGEIQTIYNTYAPYYV